MALPPTKYRGSIISHQDMNVLANVGRQAYRITGDGIDVRAAETGISIARQTEAEVRPNMVKAEHITPLNAPRYGLVRLLEGLATGDGPLIATCKRPDQSGFGTVGSLQGGAGELDIVWVQHKGVGKVRFDATTVPGAIVPYRLGCLSDSYDAQYDTLGPMVLLKDLGEIDGNIHLGEVLFKGLRGDNKVCNTGDVVIDGPYRTIVWSASYTVTEDSVGEITIALM